MSAEADMTCGLIGPVKPFWGASTLRAMGTSRVLPLGAYIAWRLLLAGLAGLGLGMVVMKDLYSLRGTQLIALLFAAYVNLRLVFVSGKFRKVERDGGDVNVATFMFSHIALVYQGALVLQLFSPLSLMFTLDSELDRTDINNALYSKEMAIVAPIGVLAVLSLLDIFISSINFRLTYALYSAEWICLSSRILSLCSEEQFTDFFFFRPQLRPPHRRLRDGFHVLLYLPLRFRPPSVLPRHVRLRPNRHRLRYAPSDPRHEPHSLQKAPRADDTAPSVCYL